MAPLPQQTHEVWRGVCLHVMKRADWHFSVPLCRSVSGVRHLIIINILIGLCERGFGEDAFHTEIKQRLHLLKFLSQPSVAKP